MSEVPAAAAPAPTPAPATFPGKTLGIVAAVLGFLAPLVGLILGFVANSQSKKAGYKNTPAKVGIIAGAILTVLYIVLWIVLIVVGLNVADGAKDALCEGQAPGTYELTDGSTIVCE